MMAEDRLLLTAVRVGAGLAPVAELQPALERPIDWTRLMTAVGGWGVGPLVFAAFREIADRVPPEVLQPLQAVYLGSAAANTAFLGAVQHVLAALNAARIPTIVLKGIQLAGQVYPNVALRSMADVDLLVAPADLDAACRVVEALGYRWQPDEDGFSRPFAERYIGEVALFRDGPFPERVEIHGQLLTLSWFRRTTRLDLAEVWDRAQPIRVDGQTGLQLSPEDTLLYLCVHLTVGHNARHLPGLVDIACWIAHHGDRMGWDALVERARRYRLRTATYLGLFLARSLVQADVPVRVLRQLAPSWVRRRAILSAVPLERGTNDRSPLLDPDTRLFGNDRVRFLAMLLVDRPWDLPGMVAYGVFPGRDWIAERYSVRGRLRTLGYCVWHPWRVFNSGLKAGRTLIGRRIVRVQRSAVSRQPSTTADRRPPPANG
jgi:hypothetical protein